MVGVRGTVLEPTDLERGRATSRVAVGEFDLRAAAVVVTSGGIGHNHELIRKNWPVARFGPPPKTMIAGVPAHVDGRMLEISERAGGSIVNRDRMWHYTEGIINWDPIWPNHAIRIIPGPSSLWLDAHGKRLPAPNFPGFDTNASMKEILATGEDYSWFVLNQSIIEKEFALSGSEQNPDITGKDLKLTLKSRAAEGRTGAGRGVQGARSRLRRRRHAARARRRHEQDRARPAARLRRRSSVRSWPATRRSATSTARTCS